MKLDTRIQAIYKKNRYENPVVKEEVDDERKDNFGSNVDGENINYVYIYVHVCYNLFIAKHIFYIEMSMELSKLKREENLAQMANWARKSTVNLVGSMEALITPEMIQQQIWRESETKRLEEERQREIVEEEMKRIEDERRMIPKEEILIKGVHSVTSLLSPIGSPVYIKKYIPPIKPSSTIQALISPPRYNQNQNHQSIKLNFLITNDEDESERVRREKEREFIKSVASKEGTEKRVEEVEQDEENENEIYTEEEEDELNKGDELNIKETNLPHLEYFETCIRRKLPPVPPTKHPNSPKLGVLDLSGRALSSRIPAIAAGLREEPEIKVINVHENRITSKTAKNFSKVISENDNIIELIASRNKFSINGTICLGEALKVSNSLAIIDLSFNMIGNEGTVALCNGLKENQVLTSLILQKDNISEEGMGIFKFIHCHKYK